MDGINGISAAQAGVGGLGLALVAWQVEATGLALAAALMAAVALGFLPFNFPTARVFLGDVGSYFFGAWMAVIIVGAVTAGVAIEAAVSPVLIYLADTSSTLLRRVLRRESWYRPHRSHVYQRLTQLGWSHARATGLVAVAIAVCTGFGWVAAGAQPSGRIGAAIGMGAVTAAYLASPVLVRRLRTQHRATI